MITQPFFSIITAVFNDSAGLQRTLESLNNQSYNSFESIVIDGGSTDNTLDIIKSSNIVKTFVSEKDNGIADAWNKGIALSQGEYILILNAGDTYEKNMLSIIKEITVSSPNKIICANARILSQDGKEVGIFKANPKALSRGMYIPHNWCAVPRSLYNELGFYKCIDHSMDFEWFHRYFKKYGINGFKIIQQILGNYYLGGHSDKAYKYSFLENKKIIMQHDNRILIKIKTNIDCFLNIKKHQIKRLLIEKNKKIKQKNNDEKAEINIVLPFLCTSGGIFEALNLAKKISTIENKINIVSLLENQEEIECNFKLKPITSYKPNATLLLFQYPHIIINFILLSKRNIYNEKWIFTHYTTLPLAFFIEHRKRILFVQGIEWKFLHNKITSFLIKKLMMFFLLRSKIITTNHYLTNELINTGINRNSILELPIWANISFYSELEKERDIDFIMVLRKGSAKRHDLYVKFIKEIKNIKNNFKIAIITPNEELMNGIENLIDHFLIKPSILDMKFLYERSKCFILLSDHEGFGLPPLEAMGSGCVPICRDSNGIRAYMIDDLSENLIPLEENITIFCKKSIDLILNNKKLTSQSKASKRIFLLGYNKHQHYLTSIGSELNEFNGSY